MLRFGIFFLYLDFFFTKGKIKNGTTKAKWLIVSMSLVTVARSLLSSAIYRANNPGVTTAFFSCLTRLGSQYL